MTKISRIENCGDLKLLPVDLNDSSSLNLSSVDIKTGNIKPITNCNPKRNNQDEVEDLDSSKFNCKLCNDDPFGIMVSLKDVYNQFQSKLKTLIRLSVYAVDKYIINLALQINP